MKFNEFNLTPALEKALEEMNYAIATPIQQLAIPPLLKGHDVLGCAQTGTGKTCAFALPILQRLLEQDNKTRKIKALILTPTRELALQIYDNFVSYSKYTKIKSTVIFGGVKQAKQVESMRNGIEVLVATPGRLNDLHQQKLIDLSHVEVFVLDEADRMLDMGFIHDVQKIMHLLPKKRQSLLFSATMPKEIKKLTLDILVDPIYVEVKPEKATTELVSQELYYVDAAKKKKLLIHLIRTLKPQSMLVFTRTKHLANRVVKDLGLNGIEARAIHGNKSQNQRQEALDFFKKGKIQILIATDIAARGIDIEDLEYVVNYDLPNIAETYVHRIGRTGRAEKSGKAISFCDSEERAYLKDIQKLITGTIEVVKDDEYLEENLTKATAEKRESSPPHSRNTRAPKKASAHTKSNSSSNSTSRNKPNQPRKNDVNQNGVMVKKKKKRYFNQANHTN